MGTSRKTIAAIAAFTTIWPGIALPQQLGTGPAPGPATAAPVTNAPATTAPTGLPTPAPTRTGGLDFTIDFDSTMTVDDNFQLQPNSSGTSTIWDNRLVFSLSSITGAQDFSAVASGVFRYADIPGRSVSGFEDPTIRLRYVLDSVDSRLSLTGRYRNVDREFLDPFQIEQEEQNINGLIGDGGTLEILNANLNYVTGINAPLTFTLDLAHDEKRYSNVTNPRLFDTETDSADVGAQFRVTPLTQLRLRAGISQFSAQDAVGTDRESTNYSIGVVQDINPILVLDAQVGWSEVDTVSSLGRSQRSGATGDVNLTRAMINGTASVNLGTSLNQNGSRTTLRFSRSLQLPSGSVSASLGGVRTPNDQTHVIGTLAYTHQLKTSDVNVSLNRSVSTNSSSEDILDTRLSVGYGYEINNNSRLDLALNWGRSESAGIGTAPTITRTSLRAAYTRNLTQDWDLTGGVLLRSRDDSGSVGSAESSALFLTIDRSFDFRP